jgi:low temperature requirement protein LtrA
MPVVAAAGAGSAPVALENLAGRERDEPLRASERKVTWVELFFDLVFVAAVSQVGAPLAASYSFNELGRYGFLLLVIWWAWHGYAVYATRFDTDDRIERAATLAQMLAVIFMAANAENGLDSVSSAGFAAAYAVMRFILVARYLRAARRPRARRLAHDYATGFGAAAAMWLVSSVAPVPWRYALWVTALAVDFGTAVVAARHTLALPPHASHLPERSGLFTLILLGEAIVAVMKGIQGQPDWTWPAATTALSGVALVCAVWWAYFEGTAAAADRHVRCEADRRRFTLWSYAHVPLYLGVALAGVGVEHAVKAGGWHTLHGEEAALLGVSLALVTGALAMLHATRVQTTLVQSTAVQSTAVQSTRVQSTRVQSTRVQSTYVQSTPVQTTVVQDT